MITNKLRQSIPIGNEVKLKKKDVLNTKIFLISFTCCCARLLEPFQIHFSSYFSTTVSSLGQEGSGQQMTNRKEEELLLVFQNNCKTLV